jgi:hypothetical protein
MAEPTLSREALEGLQAMSAEELGRLDGRGAG